MREWKRCAVLDSQGSVSGDPQGAEYSQPGGYDAFQRRSVALLCKQRNGK